MDDDLVLRLVEEVLESHRSPADVCAAHPELLGEVEQRLRAYRRLEGRLDHLLPQASPSPTFVDEAPLPEIPGYEILTTLGAGGMGIVYLARHLALGRQVALKMMLYAPGSRLVERERLLREARAMAALRHPNIVCVYDVGEVDGHPFFTMEHMEGGSLADRLGGRPLPPDESARTTQLLAGAIAAAHDHGIVHRDLKPANVLLTADSTPKVSDFGISRSNETQPGITRTGARLGTPNYMAPEQALGRTELIGPATDVHALGAILYELLTGRPPFSGASAVEVEHRLVHEDAVSPRLLTTGVSRDLETICLACLRKDPARRYASAAELDADLQRFLRHEPILARPIGRAERSWNWCRRKPALAGLVITGVALLVLTIASLLREMGLAATRRAEFANIEHRLENVLRLEADGQLDAARTRLDGLADGGSEDLRRRIAKARADLELAVRLEEIRLQRAVLSDERFGTEIDRASAEERYRAAFAAAELGSPDEPAADVAARVAASGVRVSLVAALDDWSLCATDESRRSWLLDVAQRADPAAPEWLRRLRDPAAWRDPDALAELAMSDAGSQPVTLLLGLAARLRGAGKDGTALLERLLRRHADDFWLHLAMAEAVFWQDSVAAVRYYQAAVALRPGSAVPRADLARALAAAGRQQEAVDHLQIAIGIDPGLAMAHCWLGNALSQMGRRDEAIEAYRTSIGLAPGHWQTHSNLGVALAESGRLDEAVEQYEAALAIRPDAGDAHANLGNALGGLDRRDEAIAHYRLGVATAPELVSTNYNLGFGLWNLGRFDEAIGYLRKAIQLNPQHRFANLHLAECLKDRGRIREAIAVYQQCMTLRVGDERPRLVLRRMQSLQQGRGEDARAAWQAWLEGVPREHCLWEGYAELCAFVGHFEEYHRACDVLVTSFGDGEDVRAAGRAGFSGALVSRTEPDVQRASQLVERAVAADATRYEAWERPWFLFAQGLLAYRSGRFEHALGLLSVAPVTEIGVAPQLVAAMAHQRLGQTAAARELLGAAIASKEWSATSAIHRDAWVEHVLRREAEALVLPDLGALIAGQPPPRDQNERLALLGVCEFEGRQLMLVRLYTDAFAADPTLTAVSSADHLRRAARAAAFAGSGRGADASPLNASDMAVLRQQARVWLRQSLAAWRRALDEDLAGQREAAALAVGGWQNEPGFAVLREPGAGEYGPDERDDCRSLWGEVEQLLTRAATR